MLHFFTYRGFRMIHEHVGPVFEVFNQRIMPFVYVPAGLLLLAALVLWWQAPAGLPKRRLAVSAGLCLVSVTATFGIAATVFAGLPVTGFTAAAEARLLPWGLGLQVLPAAGAALLALGLMNSHFRAARPVGRWLFIAVFALLFYSAGTADMDGNVGFYLWPAIGAVDWLPFRQSGSLTIFAGVFLVPGFLPLLLHIPLIWLRPAGLPRWGVLLLLATYAWVFFITATYFVPKLQLPLDKGFSRPLIEELLRNDFRLRGAMFTAMYFVMAGLFLKLAARRQEVRVAESVG